MNSNSHKTLWATILGAVLWILTGSGAAIVSHFLPDSVVAVMHALGELITALGGLSMFHQNTQATKAVAETTAAAVTKAITNAPVDLAPNPAVVAAQSRNPLVNR